MLNIQFAWEIIREKTLEICFNGRWREKLQEIYSLALKAMSECF